MAPEEDKQERRNRKPLLYFGAKRGGLAEAG